MSYPQRIAAGLAGPPPATGAGSALAVAGGGIEAVASAPVHEHVGRLVEVNFDDTGRSVREFACIGCPSVWFD